MASKTAAPRRSAARSGPPAGAGLVLLLVLLQLVVASEARHLRALFRFNRAGTANVDCDSAGDGVSCDGEREGSATLDAYDSEGSEGSDGSEGSEDSEDSDWDVHAEYSEEGSADCDRDSDSGVNCDGSRSGTTTVTYGSSEEVTVDGGAEGSASCSRDDSDGVDCGGEASGSYDVDHNGSSAATVETNREGSASCDQGDDGVNCEGASKFDVNVFNRD